MLKRQSTATVSNPHCSRAVDNLTSEDFLYYDVDGFELSLAEQQYYRAMGYPIDYLILNHCCWQESWFELYEGVEGLMLHHAMLLHRCDYQGAAREQLLTLQKNIPWANQLLMTRIKWGFDFNLYGIADDATLFEVIHIEYDNTDYDNFNRCLHGFEFTVKHIDWQDAARRVWNKRTEWQPLKGFDQNHWKAKYLIGWDRSEIVEKAS